MTAVVETTQPTTARGMVEVLRRHYLPESRPASGIFLTELTSPDGRRRADVLWFPLTIADGAKIIGHEIKVSRADVLAELADPTKADPWSRYCHQWWLTVSDPRLVDGLDIPEAWGVMAPPSGRRTRSMTVIKPAPDLAPVDPAPAFHRALASQFWRQNDERREWKDERRTLEHRVNAAEQETQRFRDAGVVVGPEGEEVAAVVKAMRAAGVYVDTFGRPDGISPREVADALHDLQVVRRQTARARAQLGTLLRSVRAAADPLAGVVKDFEKAAKKAGFEYDSGGY